MKKESTTSIGGSKKYLKFNLRCVIIQVNAVGTTEIYAYGDYVRPNSIY